MNRGQALGEMAPADGVAKIYAAVTAIEELEEVIDFELVQLGREGRGAQVEVVFVILAGIDVDGTHHTKRVRVFGSHADRIQLEPAAPNVVAQQAALRLEGQLDRPVGIG